MIYGMYLSTSGAKAQSHRQDVIANNIANADTAGFRRLFATARQRLDRQGEQGTQGPLAMDDPRRIGGGVHLYKTYTDLDTQGNVKPSSSPSHMAIVGDGFFRVRMGQESLLTRHGGFTFSPDGTLTTSDGKAEVLSTEGSPIRLDPNQPFEVTSDNTLVQNGRAVAKIAVVAPRDPDSIEHAGDSLLRYDGKDQPAPGIAKQFFLEGSNVDPVHEMVDLIEAARGFDINVQMVQLQNDTLRTLIDQVPRPA